MTDLVVADTLTGTRDDRCVNEGSTPMPRDFEETRRTADIRSPLTNDYDFEVLEEVLGRESATCEACQETVNPNVGGGLEGSDPPIFRELVENVCTLENQVLLCETCANRPADEWRADVRAKRARERDHEPTLAEHVAHWVSDPRATSVFARRVAVTVAGMVVLVALVATVAGIAGSLLADMATGAAWARTVITTAWAVGVALAAYPWIVGGLVGAAYTAHAIERVHYDPRGYITRERPPWVPLTVAGVLAGVGSLGLLSVATGLIPAPRLTYPLAAVVWAIGAAGVAWYIDLAIRHDFFRDIWRPARGPWMVAGRVGLLPGLLAITVGVPFPRVFPATTTGVLAAIPAGVALGFAGRRLPYDPQARDRILAMVPDRLLDRRQSD